MLWGEIDQHLYELKIAERCHELHEKTEATRRRISFEHEKLGQGMGVGLCAKLVDGDLSVLRDYLERVVDPVCREVWTAQGKSISPDFVRAMRDNAVFHTIGVRTGEIAVHMKLMAGRTGFTDLTPVLHHLALEKGKLESIMSNRYEIEARQLELRAKQEVAKVAEVFYTSRAVPNGGNVVPSHAERVHSEADLWRHFHDEFKSLANEELSILRGIREDRRLRVSCGYNSDRTTYE